tara:strand:+ start:39 stop:1757 length:1719 start_codon:yes stop_codon:yes gene_type:complete
MELKEELGFISNGELLTFDGVASEIEGDYFGHYFSIDRPVYALFELTDFSDELDIELWEYNKEFNSYKYITGSYNEALEKEYLFKYLKKGDYLLDVVTIKNSDKYSSNYYLTINTDFINPNLKITGPSKNAGDIEDHILINENSKYLHNFTANKEVKWSLNNTYDSEFFHIDEETGELNFVETADFEKPALAVGSIVRVTINSPEPKNHFFLELFDFEGSANKLTTSTVDNFLAYVRDGSYDNSIFHRSVNNFVIQGGGFIAPSVSADQPDSHPTAIISKGEIINEPGNSNLLGTVAMAKVAGQPDSATSQWFVNLNDNIFLDESNEGFTVFGKILGNGIDVINKMANTNIYDASDYYQIGALGELPLWTLADNQIIQPANFLTISNINELLNDSGIDGYEYEIVVRATDENNKIAEQSLIVSVLDVDESNPTPNEITIKDTVTGQSFSLLDVDGDGKVTAFGDGLMVIRKLFGSAFFGDNLTAKAISAEATRGSTEVHEYIQSGVDNLMLDVDGDGKVTAFGDGLMVIRKLFGSAFAGDALTAKAISGDATRNTDEIHEYINTLTIVDPIV